MFAQRVLPIKSSLINDKKRFKFYWKKVQINYCCRKTKKNLPEIESKLTEIRTLFFSFFSLICLFQCLCVCVFFLFFWINIDTSFFNRNPCIFKTNHFCSFLRANARFAWMLCSIRYRKISKNRPLLKKKPKTKSEFQLHKSIMRKLKPNKTQRFLEILLYRPIRPLHVTTISDRLCKDWCYCSGKWKCFSQHFELKIIFLIIEFFLSTLLFVFFLVYKLEITRHFFTIGQL